MSIITKDLQAVQQYVDAHIGPDHSVILHAYIMEDDSIAVASSDSEAPTNGVFKGSFVWDNETEEVIYTSVRVF